METLQEYMIEYRRQLERGTVQKAYRGLMNYLLGLRTHLKARYPDYYVSSSLYHGYMDMTYFAFTPDSLKQRRLKIAIVFVYDAFRFEVWLAGANKKVQTHYWQLFHEHGWNKYHLVPSTQGVDAILEHVLVEDPDFSDLDALTVQIESGTLKVIEEIEGFLSQL